MGAICDDNRFPAPQPRTLNSGAGSLADVWTRPELSALVSDSEWTVGSRWTLSASVTSAASISARFGFGGEGGFFIVSIPPGFSSLRVTDIVRRVETQFEFRGKHLDGDITFTDVCLTPEPALPPVEPEDVCEGNRFPAPQPRVLSAGSKNLADVWFAAELHLLAADPEWTVGHNWTLSAIVSSTASTVARFAFGGGGGFFQVSVPPGTSSFNLTDTVRHVQPLFEFRGSYLDGDVTFTHVCLKPTPMPLCEDNRFPATQPRTLRSGSANLADVWTHIELGALVSDSQWTVGSRWTLSAKVTSAASEDASFGFGGEGGFFKVSIPPGGSMMRVTDTVRRIETQFEFRGERLDGDVTFTDVCLTPEHALPPVEPEDVCEGNWFPAPQPRVLSAGAGSLTDVWFAAELRPLVFDPAWTAGSRWTLSATVSSRASSRALFGFGGGGGFFRVSVPPGNSSFSKTDIVRQAQTLFDFRGSYLDGDVTFTNVCLRPEPALPPVEPEDVCEGNRFPAPQPRVMSAASRRLADVWFAAELGPLFSDSAWVVGGLWEMSFQVSSKASSNANFGFGGGGGFFKVSVPPGNSSFNLTDTVRRVDTAFEFRSRYLDGDVTFTNVCMRPAP